MITTSALIKKDDRTQIIGLFQELAQKQELTPQNLVNMARDEKHALHKYFEWHDGVAGEKYRQQQARQLIQSVRVQIITAPEQVTSVRAIMSLPPNTAQGETKARYVMTSEIAASEDATTRIKEQAIVELSRFRKKYDTLAKLPEFAKVFEAVDKLSS